MRELLLGAVCGLFVAAPPGPLGALVAQQSLAGRRRDGLACGLALAAADAVHACAACFLSSELGAEPGVLRRGAALAAAVVLFALGWRALRRAPARHGERERAPGAAGIFALGLLTPGTLPAFVLLFATFEVRGAPLAALGACASSLAWWMLLVGGLGLLRERAARVLVWVEGACGWLLCLGACGAVRIALS